jgi:hypothetical protein
MLTSAKIGKQNGDTRTCKPEPGLLTSLFRDIPAYPAKFWHSGFLQRPEFFRKLNSATLLQSIIVLLQ